MNWEIEILQILQGIRSQGLTAMMEAISFMAESIFLVTIIATLYWCIDKKKTSRMAWILLFSGLTNGIIKNIIKAPRPFEKGIVSPLRIETATSYSFPSGHTQSATTFWLGSAWILNNKSIAIIGMMMILLTGISRLYLGVHWPIDIIGGIITGILSIIIADLLYDEEKGFTPFHVIGVGVVCFIFLFMPIDGDLASGLGALWGFVVGSYIEQKHIQFSVAGDWKLQVKKLLIGFLGTAILYIGFDKIFLEYTAVNLIQYACILLWIVAGAPYLFKKLKKDKTLK